MTQVFLSMFSFQPGASTFTLKQEQQLDGYVQAVVSCGKL